MIESLRTPQIAQQYLLPIKRQSAIPVGRQTDTIKLAILNICSLKNKSGGCRAALFKDVYQYTESVIW